MHSHSKIRIICYLVLSLSWLVLVRYIGRLIPDHQLWFGLLFTFLLGLPIYLSAIYAVTIQKIYRSSQFRKLGIIYGLVTARILAYIWWALWAITFTFLLLFYLGAANMLEWTAFFITVPVFFIIHTNFASLATREFKPYITLHKSLIWARWATALVMAVIYVLLLKLAGDLHLYTSLAQAIQLEGQRYNGSSNSVLIGETARLLGFFEGMKIYALGNLQSLNGVLYLGFVFLGSVMLFYNIALVFSSFMVPVTEYRRVLEPIQDTDQPAPISYQSLAITSAFVTFFVCFIYVPTMVYIDGWLGARPQIVEQLHESQAVAVETVEMIENDYYKPGTIAQTRQVYLDLVNELNISINELRRASDIAFQHMAGNVDGYLDWYYSLPGEYERIVALATGVLEKWMAEKLESYLIKDNAFALVQQSIENALQKNEQLHAEYLNRIDQILIENSVLPRAQKLEIVNYSSLSALKEPPSDSVIVNLENRLLISGGMGAAGAVTGVIAGKVTAKVVGKGAIQFGAKALIKVTTSKATSAIGGTAAGITAGAMLGSAFPGIGTAVGAAVGGIIGGITIGLTVEKLLLMLEEAYSRDEFKRQILEAIEDAQLEFEALLYSDS